MVNPLNGSWAKMDEDDGREPDPTVTPNQSIVPWVMDRKNALLFQLAEEGTSEVTIATLQYAIKRGVESVYQLEESELLAEPLPDRKTRKGVLLYEATEGGAGVLTRLVHDDNALANVARAALKVMHFDIPAVGQPLPAIDDLHDVAGTQCVAGCYRCVLSYYNQPDHPVIDRRDAAARALLLRLAAVRTHLMPASDESASATDAEIAVADASGVAVASVAASVPSQGGFSAAAHGLPEPTAVGKPIDNAEVLALWRGQRVALVGHNVDPAPLRDRGLEVFVWPADDAQAQADVVAQLAQKLS